MSEKKHTDMYLASEIEQYIQVKDTRYTLDEFNRIGDYLLGRNLTDDQQVVLEWLKENGNPNEPFSALDELTGEVFYTEGFKTCIYVAFNNLTGKQQFQVLAAFAEWGLNNL